MSEIDLSKPVKEEKQFLLFDEPDEAETRELNLFSQQFHSESTQYKTYSLPPEIQFETSNEISFLYYVPDDEGFKKVKGKGNQCRNCKQLFKFPSPEEKQRWQASRMPCPHCHYTYSTLPESEKVLQILQERYHSSERDIKILHQIQNILKSYAKSLVLAERSLMVSSVEHLEYFSHLAASFLIEEYFKNPDFKITVSFGGYLTYKVQQALYAPSEWGAADTREATGYSLDYETEEISSQYLARSKCDTSQEIEAQIENETLHENIMSTITEFRDFCSSPYENFMRLLGLRLYFFKTQHYSDKFFNAFNRNGKIAMDETLQLIASKLSKTVRLEPKSMVASRVAMEEEERRKKEKVEPELTEKKRIKKLTKEEIKEKFWGGVKVSFREPKPKLQPQA